MGWACSPCDSLSLTAFDMVPFLPSVLSTMFPMLSMTKQDALKVVFCCGKTVGVAHPSPSLSELGPSWEALYKCVLCGRCHWGGAVD